MVRDNELSFGDFWFQNLSKARAYLDLKCISTIFRNFQSKKLVSLDFDKKFKKKFFFSIFLAKNQTFSIWNWILHEQCFFWYIICWCRSKIAKFWNFANFLAMFRILSIFAFFLWFVEKNSEKGSNHLEMIQNNVETWFLTFLWLQSRKK